MKKNKGFTLIELLAIIVILAIIAVITVPIILNIIENSQKGAASDSAYGYKDAVNKYYVSKLAQDKDYTMDDGTYTTTELKELGVSLSGKEPNENSWVAIENNNVTNGCLQFDEYKVDIENGKVTTTEKGECVGPLPCPGSNCVYAFYTTSKNYGPNSTGSVLTDYTTDYTTLSEHHGARSEHSYFLGHILDNDGKIERGFVCGTRYNGTIFCIEGTTDGAKYEKNKEISLEDKITNYDMPIVDNANWLQHGDSAFMVNVGANGEVNIVVNGPSGGCYVKNNGTMYCNTN